MSRDDRLAGLADVARDVLRSDIQPSVPPERRYAAAMIAHALAVVARGLTQGEDIAAGERAALAGLCPDLAEASLPRLRRRLAGELRSDRLSPDREERIRAALLAVTLARLTVTSPDYPETYKR